MIWPSCATLRSYKRNQTCSIYARTAARSVHSCEEHLFGSVICIFVHTRHVFDYSCRILASIMSFICLVVCAIVFMCLLTIFVCICSFMLYGSRIGIFTCSLIYLNAEICQRAAMNAIRQSVRHDILSLIHI